MIPLYRFRLHCTLSPDAAGETILSVTRGPLGFMELLRRNFHFSSPPSDLFVGSVKNGTFQIYRNIRYRNSFLPQVQGRIVAEGNGSHIEVSMSTHPFVMLFMALWPSLAGIGALVSISALQASSLALIPPLMFVFGILLMLIGFIPEAIMAKNMLTSLLLDAPDKAMPTRPET
jgi:hypothetical protein